MNEKQLKNLINELVSLPTETEWVEFKHNFHSKEEIGERISALANSACLINQPFGYLVFGINDFSHQILGTSFNPATHKAKGNEDIEHWLLTRLNPKIDFHYYNFNFDGKNIVIFVIPAAQGQPVSFLHTSYVRIGSITRKLKDFPEKERKIWLKQQNSSEKNIVKYNLSSNEIIQLLSTETYFDLMKLPYPSNRESVINKLVEEDIVIQTGESYGITKIGALLFAKQLSEFKEVYRKTLRIIVYKGNSKVETEREQIGIRGYAIELEGLIDWINSQLPTNEEIGKALRKESRMYPKIAIRELVVNALIHQDLEVKGFPMIEIFQDRIEISNPGIPLVTPERFIDGYISRNERFADLMRRMGFCEEKGSGLDKVVFYNELYQLPPINITVDQTRTKVSLYAYKSLNHLDKKEKIRATYQHACLKYVSNEKMTNQSLRNRFKIEDHNYSIASRIIKEALKENVIKEEDPESKSRKYAKYIPFWA